ncbi:glycosyltransferase family 2 protein [Bifidobacterium sp. ESL0732]|uniref:glycosyltransferase family 2 protein n=1 Tax=Bifidobacterium sp. ESL0732 TaxID=2983222 RepID=UPI0023F6F90F|nr:glycosyltransferase family 2 protein [Bifidobacterium sp. ESL0732]WEV64330.1 glycosyltransferase family 2 protein [Bifidobacterium sp. ESL0732]
MYTHDSLHASVGVAIPTLNAEQSIGALIESLKRQTVKPDEILVIDSASNDQTVSEARSHGASVTVINRAAFNHGLTRHQAVLKLPYDYVLFLTQDAMPANDQYIEKLIKPLIQNEHIAISSGRQIPKPDARRFEQLVREFNYPPASFVRDRSDLSRLGIKTYFASDVCSAYPRKIYMKLGGFDECNTNEDMLMAAKCINAGYSIAYAADAKVIHSHNLSIRAQFKRNKEIGHFLKSHQQMFNKTSELHEGKRMFSFIASTLIRERRPLEFIRFVCDCGARFLGNRFGRIQSRNRQVID